jgi:virulence-associated protein VagC
MTKTVEILNTTQGQMVVLPPEMRFEGSAVAVRQDGAAVILEPLRPAAWPPGFFESIRIDDPAFGRADQGELPAAPTL